MIKLLSRKTFIAKCEANGNKLKNSDKKTQITFMLITPKRGK